MRRTRYGVKRFGPSADETLGRLVPARLHLCDRLFGMRMNYDADVIVVGAGLAGLVAAAELAAAGCRVVVLDQEP